MNYKKIKQIWSFIFLSGLLVFTFSVNAQNASDLRFNEILVHNETNSVDDYGVRSSWIEIFNSAYNPVNIAGCYLTDDIKNPKKYWIPTGNPATEIPPRGYLVFRAGNNPARGIFHLNFDIKDAREVILFDASGRTIIDKIEIVQPQKPDVSFGKKTDDSPDWSFFSEPTPGAGNNPHKEELAGESFAKMDPYGIGMTIIAMFVVFSALAILYLIYNSTGRYFVRKTSVRRKQKADDTTHEEEEEIISGELNAAIAMTIDLYQMDLHDYENTVLTIQKVSKNYSPWSSKIYNLRKMPK
jgi:Na+-transporting methylmalonyl-CoA/oxaloacetate decarboxylase gamma subunit